MSEHSGLTLPADLRAGVEQSEKVTANEELSDKNYTMQGCERARAQLAKRSNDGRTASN